MIDAESYKIFIYLSYMTTLALYNLKGGVGKTASSVNLAYLAAVDGFKTLLWDLDPQGSSGFYYAAQPAGKNDSKKLLEGQTPISSLIQDTVFEKISVIPSDLSARHADLILDEAKQSKKRIKSILAGLQEYDLVILDCPPGLSLLHENVFLAADKILMPQIPTTLSIRSFETVMQFMEDHDLDIEKVLCFFSMVDHRKNLHHETMQSFYKDRFFCKNYVPYLSDIEKMGTNQQPLFEFANSSYAAQCYRDVWTEIKKKVQL